MTSTKKFDMNDILRSLEEIQSSLSLQSAEGEKCFKPMYPRFLEKSEQNNKPLNAIIEIQTLWAYIISDAAYIYPKFYSKLTVPVSAELKHSLQKDRQRFAVYDNLAKAWLVEPEEPKYKYCFNGEQFIEFREARLCNIGKRFLLVGKYTVLQQEPNLLKETETAPDLFNNFVMPKITLTVGVPGCGKTTYIIKNHRCGSLVLTSCAEGAQDIRTRMAEKYGGHAPDYKDSYRTIDSYLINSRKRYSTVWVDEALMEHPGKLFLVCLFTGCKQLCLLGDPNQLGFINRHNEITLLYHKSSIFFKASINLSISFRCPVDVITLISNNYEEGAFSASHVLRSLRWKTFTKLKCVPKSKDIKYLVFKQAEKKRMEKEKYDVSTIHEFQGKEADNVVLVRMSRNLNEPLYESAPHILVGISRHRKSFVYYTPVTDYLKRLINEKLTFKELKKTQIKLQAKNHKRK